jgi:two-component system CheB/CheR fusion protein
MTDDPPSSARLPSPAPGGITVVGIGASAGGLEACRNLLAALPAGNGMAFILVQHLDPTHESMLATLLASGTPMTVLQAAEGMPVSPDHLYVIPPGAYLGVGDGALRLSEPQARHGARLPFDFLLHALAEEYGTRAVAVILSGTGADGSLGLKSIKEQCGLVIAQDPEEAGFDGMPRSAIMTGGVDLVLPVAEIPAALVQYDRRIASAQAAGGEGKRGGSAGSFARILDLVRSKTAFDFRLYKQGTLERRIERRMAMAAVEIDNVDWYLDILRRDEDELDRLARELLIHVTSFFRDPMVFDYLAEKIVPDLVRQQPQDQPLRLWVTGCSTGEEAYSLVMLFREAITAAKRDIKLQVFASDIDPEAVATAREGLYPPTIEAEVSPERLARFFSKEVLGYRVLPELRGAVVFTVQDLLADPPFSRIDLVSCRNLLIYLRPEAQARAVSLFHFALREGGILLLGNSEEVGNADGRFEPVGKPERIYRHIGRSRPGEFGFLMTRGDGARGRVRAGQGPAPSRQAALAELCRRMVMETYAPAAVLINRKHECLHLLGPTERYLRVAPGAPSHDLLAMARQGLRGRIAAAIQQAGERNARVVLDGGRMTRDGRTVAFSIDVQPVLQDGEPLLLVCFAEAPQPEPAGSAPASPQEVSRVAEIERELEATRAELHSAIRNLEISIEEQKAVNEEALSVNEEYQSTNEELLTSKEELQSLNEELAALNSQLQETLDRQRLMANDLQNVLYSTDMATLFLDSAFNIRFFTPATRALFNVIPGDIGRPLADLASLGDDGTLLTDARTVLQTLAPQEREIEIGSGAWFLRRILPYRTQDNAVEGVVITFNDITERKQASTALAAAKRQAELASMAKSRFLAAASHDLRQPLQTLTLLHGMLENTVEGDKPRSLVVRLGKTLGAMSVMLDALLDINQIEAGAVQARPVDFHVNALLGRLRDEYAYQAESKGLALRVVPCGLVIHSDPRLLEQMIRNLLSNALKYTRQGKVLLGCRRHADTLSIEVWDTGVGIPAGELQSIFEEYYQLDNAARERSRGLGLGLSIVRRLATLLEHRVSVRSRPGHGSVFAIEVARPPDKAAAPPDQQRTDAGDGTTDAACPTGTILVIEDDPELCDILQQFLKEEGHRVATAPDGIAALDLVRHRAVRPDLILADYNLPNGMNGLELAARLRERFRQDIPVVVLTGDISTETLRDVAAQNCALLNKPVRLQELTEAIRHMLSANRLEAPPLPH